MVTGQSISQLFQQLQQASLDGHTTRADFEVTHTLSTPPSANESDNSQVFAPSKVDESRRSSSKHTSKDTAQHKRRSHASKTGKNSALERLPSMHGHLHAHVQHSHPHLQGLTQSISNTAVNAAPAVTKQHTSHPNAADLDVAGWLNTEQQELRVDDTMDVDEQGSTEPAAQWPMYDLNTSQFAGSTGLGVNAMHPSPFTSSNSDVPSLRPGPAVDIIQSSGRSDLSTRLHPVQGTDTFAVMASSPMDAARRSSSGLNMLAQQLRLRQQQQMFFPTSADDKVDLFSGQNDLFADPLQDFLDPLVPSSAVGPGWNPGWNVSSVSESGRADDDNEAGALLSFLPLSHHHWAGDLHHHNAASTSWYNAQLQQPNPAHYGNSLPPNSTSSQTYTNVDSFNLAPTAETDSEAVLRAMSVDTFHSQQRPSTTHSGFAGENISRAEQADSPNSLDLNREQTFTARDVSSRQSQTRDDNAGDGDDDSGDEQRRRSTDTLRRAEGSLEQALESVEDTRALLFAQQFSYDDGSDEEAGGPADDDDGYEEDEEDDDDVDCDLSTNCNVLNRNFDPIFGAATFQQPGSDSYAASLPDVPTDFLDGPFHTTGAGGQTGFSVDDSNLALYQDLTRSPRFTADTQAFLASLNQDVPTWASAVSDSEMVRPFGGRNAGAAQSPTISRGSINTNSSSGVRSASSASHTNRRPNPHQPPPPYAAATSTGASFLSGMQALGGTPSGNANTATASGAGLISMDSLWATSGSLDRLEHLYLEGLHSSPSISHATTVAAAASAASGLGGTEFGTFGGGNYTGRPGWMSNPGESVVDTTNTTPHPAGAGYLSE